MIRANSILLGTLAALCGVLLVLERPWAKDRFAESLERASTPVFPAFDPAKAAKIEIRTAKEEVALERRPQGWVVPAFSGYRAGEEQVAQLLERVSSMKRADVATRDRGTGTSTSGPIYLERLLPGDTTVGGRRTLVGADARNPSVVAGPGNRVAIVGFTTSEFQAHGTVQPD